MGETLFPVVVSARHDFTDDLFVVELSHPLGEVLPMWEPGAHIDVQIGGNDLRQYSLAGVLSDQHTWRLGIRREVDGRGGSSWIHENAIVGREILVGGPRNHFQYTAGTGQPITFIAGGIGITPILPMIEQAIIENRPWHLHYVGSSLKNMPFLEELEKLGDSVSFYPRDTSPRPDVNNIIRELSFGSAVYSCGPEALMEQVEACGHDRTDLDINVERFSPRDVGDDRGLDTFEVEFNYSEKTVQIGPDQSILQAARDAGIEVVSSCQEGTCGSCETPVMKGTPIHLDSVLSEKEREESACMMICVSRSLSERLVLDM
ncbi:MAG: hypothetical protein RI926_1227 [Actinomycetota bacterium]|jgi:ferredoxin-NADP reductase